NYPRCQSARTSTHTTPKQALRTEPNARGKGPPARREHQPHEPRPQQGSREAGLLHGVHRPVSRILSEEEVDALLRGVREGAIPDGGRATASGVQRLDLTSQERNLRGRLPGLELVVDRFVRGLRTSLGALLGQVPDLDVRGPELLKFARVTARLPQPVGLGVFRMPPLRGQGLLVVTPALVTTLLQVFCGGAPGRTTPVAGRDLSGIEQRVLEPFGARVLHDLKEAGRPLAAIEFGALDAETNPLFATIAGPQDPVVLLALAVGIAGQASPGLWLCLPNAALDPLRHRLQA